MANEEHLRILKQGAAAWALWRAENPDVLPDLSGADLDKASLSWADLSWANLHGANLWSAGLMRANLSGTNLSGANLSGADLSRANLSKADLREADFSGADLHDAELSRAHLNRAVLFRADLSKAYLFETTFADVDLSTARGLETCRHGAPSTIDHRTLAKSGPLPDAFLRGCGLQPWQIEEAKLLNPDLTPAEIADIQAEVFRLRTRGPLLKHNLFISYSHADKAFVDALEVKLVTEGILFWRDIHHAVPGRIDENLRHAMRQNPVVLLVLSKNSIGSDWVEHEVELATQARHELKRNTLCPIALDAAWKGGDWSGQFMTQIKKYIILCFANWADPAAFETQFRRLIKGLDLFYKPPTD